MIVVLLNCWVWRIASLKNSGVWGASSVLAIDASGWQVLTSESDFFNTFSGKDSFILSYILFFHPSQRNMNRFCQLSTSACIATSLIMCGSGKCVPLSGLFMNSLSSPDDDYFEGRRPICKCGSSFVCNLSTKANNLSPNELLYSVGSILVL